MADPSRFERAYVGAPPPWDIGKPQQPFVDAAAQITGQILDAGCGTGENALFFAARGERVTGIDFVEGALVVARRKAAERGLTARFVVKDALTLSDWGERFDSVIDSGLFHVFDDADRKRYVEGLTTIVKPNGHVFLMCFSDAVPGTEGPRRVSQRDLTEAFAAGWTIESITGKNFEIRPEYAASFEGAFPPAWFMIARRVAGP